MKQALRQLTYDDEIGSDVRIRQGKGCHKTLICFVRLCFGVLHRRELLERRFFSLHPASLILAAPPPIGRTGPGCRERRSSADLCEIGGRCAFYRLSPERAAAENSCCSRTKGDLPLCLSLAGASGTAGG
ncbi:hypothetical protein CEXT_205581 [Caerostris extrusa]|uniref:Uncharacterized protein n=1 Tax=Caerostris extrusa TaxID=172846 RepID=A0AAV4Y469_CAEEX|nr:hypothetical protein CEXT_205581 [Caerostris extrusa]